MRWAWLVSMAAVWACGGPDSPPVRAADEGELDEPTPARRSPPPFILSVEPGSGPSKGGNEVRLRCTNLDAQPKVFFAGREAEVETHKVEGDSHELVVVAPPGPAGMAVEVVVVGRQQAVRERGYSYAARESDQPPPEPAVTVSRTAGIEVCEEYFDIVERCMSGMQKNASVKKAIDNARKQIRKMAEKASTKEIEAMAESCQKAMDSVAKTFKNCKP